MKKSIPIIALIIALVIFVVVVPLDITITKFMESLRTPLLDVIFSLITHLSFLIITLYIIPASALILSKRKREAIILSLILPLSYLLSELIKTSVERARPTEIVQLVHATGYSFPSGHALVAFAAIPLIISFFPKFRITFIITAIMIAFSRVFIGVHYTSDIIGGALIGLILGSIALLFLDEKETNLELRRQSFHILFGTTIILLIHQDIATPIFLLSVLFCGIGISIIAMKCNIPLISQMLSSVDRKGFCGYGAITFTLGSLIALTFFEKNIALAGIAILTLGDAITTLAGLRFGRIQLPQSKKTLEGSIFGIIAGTIAATLFVLPVIAFIGSIAGIIAEYATDFLMYKNKRIIDDNILIPIVSCLAMSVILGSI